MDPRGRQGLPREPRASQGNPKGLPREAKRAPKSTKKQVQEQTQKNTSKKRAFWEHLLTSLDHKCDETTILSSIPLSKAAFYGKSEYMRFTCKSGLNVKKHMVILTFTKSENFQHSVVFMIFWILSSK